MEAKPPLGYKYSNFSPDPITKDVLAEIVYELIIYAISFDLYTPPADAVREISLNEILERVQSDKMKTGKRLGFKLGGEGNINDEFSW
jgi:hypothetical protein